MLQVVIKSVSILCHDIWHYSVYTQEPNRLLTDTSQLNVLYLINLCRFSIWNVILLILLRSFKDLWKSMTRSSKSKITVRVRAIGHFPKRKKKTRCIRQIDYPWPWTTLAAQNLAWIEISFCWLCRSFLPNPKRGWKHNYIIIILRLKSFVMRSNW